VFDRLLGSRFGKKAVELIEAGEKGKMVGIACSALISAPLDKVVNGIKRPDEDMLRLAEVLGT
jgi:6-phosphofructokinase 1